MKISDSDFEKLLQSEEKHSYNKTIAFQGAPEKLAGRPAFRRLAVIAVAALLAVGLIAAGAVIAAKTANGSQPPVTTDITETELVTDTGNGAKTNADSATTAAETITETETKSKLPITYTNAYVSSDRAPKTLQNQLDIPTKGYNEEYGYAVCIITALKIDLSGCSSADIGKRIPVDIRIDKILNKNPAFTLKEGDTASVGEFSAWFKTDDGYMVNTRDYIIPITEEGAQYIVLLYSAEESFQKDWWEGIEYMAEPLTIPVSEDGTYDVSLYGDMKVADDVRQCSDDFIKTYFPLAKAK